MRAGKCRSDFGLPVYRGVGGTRDRASCPEQLRVVWGGFCVEERLAPGLLLPRISHLGQDRIRPLSGRRRVATTTAGDANMLKCLGVCNAEADQRELPHGVKAEKANR